jgi:thymidine phosphorylase
MTAMHAEAIGQATHALGAGRSRVGDAIDHGVGIVAKARLGDAIRVGDTLLELHHRGGRGVGEALALCRAAIVIADEPPSRHSLVLGSVN